jgi:hypothetical protein
MGMAGLGFLAHCLNSGFTGFNFAQVAKPNEFPTAEIKMNERTCSLWARASLRVWPEKYVLLSLPTSSLAEAANILGRSTGAFAALILERDEVSLTLPEHVWRAHAVKANAQDGPYRALSFNVDVDLEVFGFIAPAHVRLANARISIVPEAAFLKEHLLVHEKDLDQTVSIVENLIKDCQAALQKK